MPKSSKDILSQVQSSLKDFALEGSALGEYISSLNDVANEIARETEIWIGRHILQPRKVGYDWSATLTYNSGDIVLDSGTYYYCIVQHTNIQPPNATFWIVFTVWDATITYSVDSYVYLETDLTFFKSLNANTNVQPPAITTWYFLGKSMQSEYKVNLPSNFNPYRIIRVLKSDGSSYTEMTEYSMQAVGRMSANNNPFPVNDVTFIDGFSTQMYNDITTIPGQIDNSLTLNFSYPLSANDYIYIDYIQGSPFEHTDWNMNPAIIIPDFLVDSFVYGLLYKMLERRFMAGNNNIYNQMLEARKQYKGMEPNSKIGGVLRRAMGYARNFKSNDNNITIQPLKWLPESDEFSA